MRIAVFAVSFLMAAPAWAQIAIDNPWSRATPPTAKVAAGYMKIRNTSAAPDRLLSARSTAAARVETHVTEREGNVSRMKEVKGYEIPAKGTFELKPGGAHLMLIDIKQPFKEGESVPLVLTFQHAGEVKTELRVGPMGASAPMHMTH